MFMPEIRCQVANAPITRPSFPGKLKSVKKKDGYLGMNFFPSLYLDRGKLYLLTFVSKQTGVPATPPPGFYPVVDSDEIVYCGRFIFLAQSTANEWGWTCWAWQGFQADPPADHVPDINFDTRQEEIANVLRRQEAERERRERS
jgi:hypothetical protein